MKWNIFLMILNSKKARRANPGNGTCHNQQSSILQCDDETDGTYSNGDRRGMFYQRDTSGIN